MNPPTPKPVVAYEDEPIKRDRCLATVWLSCAGVVLDPMPTVCSRHYGHDGWHVAAKAGTSGPEITWADPDVVHPAPHPALSRPSSPIPGPGATQRPIEPQIGYSEGAA